MSLLRWLVSMCDPDYCPKSPDRQHYYTEWGHDCVHCGAREVVRF